MLVEFLMKSTAFKFHDTFYEQLTGTPMGSPLSVVVSNIVMEEIEEIAFSRLLITPKYFRRFVDDCFLIQKISEMKTTLDTFNGVHPAIQFTSEHPTDGKLPFLDVLVQIDNKKFRTSVYRKPTHSGQYLSFDSFQPVSQKVAVVRSLVIRARRICDSDDSFKSELEKIRSDLKNNGYPASLISKTIRSVLKPPIQDKKQFRSSVVIPYCGTVSETIACTLRKYDIRVSFKPQNKTKFRLHHTRQKDPSKVKNGVYRIDCKDCDKKYVGETGRFVTTRMKDHRRSVKNLTPSSVATNEMMAHVVEKGHSFDFDNISLLARNKRRYRERLFCESFEIFREPNSVNARESVKLPSIYKALT
jgi:hypothetical protein